VKNSFKDTFLPLIISFIISFLIAFIGSSATTPQIKGWYSVSIVKPPISPPNWIFAPVWTLLFIFMAISAYLVWQNRRNNKNANIGLVSYLIQLILNCFWSISFFAMKSPLLAFIAIVLLWITILITIYYFFKVNKTAAYLIIPYILWVSFASILNFWIVLIN